ncbi:hypothetical protein EV560_108365 [Bosea sp. BK604]|nr:hypothetical protein EV560_108365 [Bosea sp. BK604]
MAAHVLRYGESVREDGGNGKAKYTLPTRVSA